MKEIIGNYEQAVRDAVQLVKEQGIDLKDLVQCDALCYRVETNERYDELKQTLGEAAVLLSEVIISGRNIATFELTEPLAVDQWDGISYIELPQPKPGSPYAEGIDHVKFVTRQGMSQFRAKYSAVPFDESGLTNQSNQLLRLKGEFMSVKLHDKHMGAVIDFENSIDESHC